MQIGAATSPLSAIAAGWRTTLAARQQQTGLEIANLGVPELETAAKLLEQEGQAIMAAGAKIAGLKLTGELLDVLA